MRKGIRALSTVGIALGLIVWTQSPGAVAQGVVAAPKPELSGAQAFTAKVLELTNAERAKHGAAPLKLEERLIQSAKWMAGDMAEFNYFGHIDRLRRGVGDRVKTYGYRYRVVAENIAAGQQTPEEVVQAWMDSPGHRANLLDSDFVEIGLAYVQAAGTTYRHYWVQVLGKPVEGLSSPGSSARQ